MAKSNNRTKGNDETPEIKPDNPPETPAESVSASALVHDESQPSVAETPGTEPATPVSAGALVESTPTIAPELPLGNAGTPPPVSEAVAEPRKRGRPKGSKNTPKAAFGDVEQIAAVAAEPIKPPVDYAAMSGAVFDMATSTLGIALGPEWLPKNPQEREMVCVPLQAYFSAKQVEDLPPGLMLTFVLVAYAVPRMKEPPTANKLRLGWQWLRSKLRRKKKPFVAAITSTPEASDHDQGI